MYLPNRNIQWTREQLIKRYFFLGFTQLEILNFMSSYHGLSMSLRTLQRILHTLDLKRHCKNENTQDVIAAVELELSASGRDLGYRAMHSRILKNHNVMVSRESVRKIIKDLDPVGVRIRQRRRLKRRQYYCRGPNFLWHIDGWDKLKPFGLAVHGCIDGYSRRIIWLRVSSSNNDPFVIGKYFTDGN